PARTVAAAVRGPGPVTRRPAHRVGAEASARLLGRGHQRPDGAQQVGRGGVTAPWHENTPRTHGAPPLRTRWAAPPCTFWSVTSAWTIWSSPTWRRSRPARRPSHPSG